MSIFAGQIKRTKIIAEFGVNHNGSYKLALKAIREVAKAGADCIKFQTYKADKLVTKTAPKFWNWKGDADKQTQYDAYKALEDYFEFGNPNKYTVFNGITPIKRCYRKNARVAAGYEGLMDECKKYGIEFLSTPFDDDSLRELMRIGQGIKGSGMQAIKVSSSDLSNIPFLKKIGFYNVPVLLSTGAATIEEIKDALEAIGHKQVILLHCTLCYPTKNEDANLNLIATLKQTFPDYEVGLSDHTIGTLTPALAVMKGARVIEKHFTLNKRMDKSADHWLSVNPKELKELVKNVRKAEIMLGSNEKRIFDCEQETYKYDKRSVVSKNSIKKGESFTEIDLTCKRPGTGIKPKFFESLFGKKALCDIPEDTTLTWDMVENNGQ